MRNFALAIALIWANHIGVDRLLGFGLKYADGFGYTHLDRPWKAASVITPLQAWARFLTCAAEAQTQSAPRQKQ